MMKLECFSEDWPLARTFTISHGSSNVAHVVIATLSGEGVRGRGEAVPTHYYGESVEQTLGVLNQAATSLASGVPVESVLQQLKPGAARNALDCAWWDWKCKRAGVRITGLLQRPDLEPLTTAYTLGIDEPEVMKQQAAENAYRPLLKIKTGTSRIVESVRAVREGAPQSRLIVDANEAWPETELALLLGAMAELGVAMIEQPLPAGRDGKLRGLKRSVPVYADESVHLSEDIRKCAGVYDGVNLKLDKTGGFSDALRAAEVARELGLGLMFGCMVGTSLSMAPAMVLAQGADFVDLDGPLLLAKDRPEGIVYETSSMRPFSAELWG